MPLLPNSKGKLRWLVHLRVTFKEPISTTISVIPSYCRHTSSLYSSSRCEIVFLRTVRTIVGTLSGTQNFDTWRQHHARLWENSQGREFTRWMLSRISTSQNKPRRTNKCAFCIICMIVGKARTGKHIDPGDSLIPFKPALGERGPVGLCPSLAGIKFLMTQHSGDAPN
jgi:hypothetical protein